MKRLLLFLLLLLACDTGSAQSGRALLHGWVAFEGVAYVDAQPRATVRLRYEGPGHALYEAQTDEHGFFDFEMHALGRARLEISAPGYETYSAGLYVPSDFTGNWAVELRRLPARPARH